MKSGFERFWTAYPRKVSKGQAAKNWLKVECEDGLTEEEMTLKIVLAADAQKRAYKDRERKFWKHPGTWLSSMCWLDEIPSTMEMIHVEQKLCPCGEPSFNGHHCPRCFYDHLESKSIQTQAPSKKEMYQVQKDLGLAKRKDETKEEYFERNRIWVIPRLRKLKSSLSGRQD